MTSVPIQVEWKEGQEEGFIERCSIIADSRERGEECLKPYSVADCLISRETSHVQMINFAPYSVKLEKGHVIRYMYDPGGALNSKETLQAEEIKAGEMKALLIRAQLEKKPVVPPTKEDMELSRPVEGGPKTLETPDSEIIPSERLLSEMHYNPELSKEQRKALEEIVWKNKDAFGLDGRLGHYPAEVEINLRPGTKEISLAPYGASPAKREVIDKQVEDWLKLDVIEPSKSAWGFPVLIVYRNNKPRMCIDYRKLNAVSIPDKFPLPKQTDILNALNGAQFLTTLDALAGFTQLKVREEDRPKTAF
ncbi:TY3B-TY3B-like protein, putative [Rhizoctonia solani AG-3 Rhs1AP]|uniref:TY3B-TY3B-like protein, putative n=2 Tax=Rhizoctonia solani AG-3 TaxID=1086053 RepID=X8JA82_9AGAM|nr:TY3B-TY3B-like protein, putative [Rhizoctonia solani AG-3 Rhs1AP]